MTVEAETNANFSRYFAPSISQYFGKDENYFSFSLNREEEANNDFISQTNATRVECFNIFPDNEEKIKLAIYNFSLDVSKISGVRAITYQSENEVTRIWTFIKRRDKEVRRLIYNNEMNLMNKYPGMFFDFNVVCMKDQSTKFIADNMHGALSFYRSE